MNIVFERKDSHKWHVTVKGKHLATVLKHNDGLAFIQLTEALMPLSGLEVISYGARMIKDGSASGNSFTVDYGDTVEFEQTIAEMVRKCPDDQLYPFLKGVRMMLPKGKS